MRKLIAAALLCAFTSPALALCVIGEYATMASQAGGESIPVWGPLIREQVVSNPTSSTTLGQTLHADTRFVRLQCNVKTHFLIQTETGASPTATTSNQWAEPGAVEGFGVTPGKQIALINGS